MPKPLTNPQKGKLCELARRAWLRECALARGRGESPDTSKSALDDYRHKNVMLACKKPGLTEATDKDFEAISGWFWSLLGDEKQAYRQMVRAVTRERRTAEHVLWKEIEKATPLGITRDYIQAICTAQFHCPISEASERQVWNLVYTCRNRAAAKRRSIKDCAGTECQPDVTPSPPRLCARIHRLANSKLTDSLIVHPNES